MTTSFDALFEVALVGFYILDSARLLYADEFLYLEVGGRWKPGGLGSGVEIVGRILWIPNPLMPGHVFVRLCWPGNVAHEEPGELASFPALVRVLNPLRYLTAGLFSLLVAGVPIALSRFGGDVAVTALASLVYLTILVMLVIAYRRRRVLGLSGAAFGKIAFDSLVCPPLALNLVPKLSSRRAVRSDALIVGRRLLDGTDYEGLLTALSRRLERELGGEAEGTDRYSVLEVHRMWLEQELTKAATAE
ncbi:MAG: hypothetical protein P8090_18380 [Gammaproteobacteria bacterium]